MIPRQGESEHRRVKRQYRRVHKGRVSHGIASQQYRERELVRMGEAAPKNTRTPLQSQKHKYNRHPLLQDQSPGDPQERDESLTPMRPEQHHYISAEVRHKVPLSMWLGDGQDDPALEVRS